MKSAANADTNPSPTSLIISTLSPYPPKTQQPQISNPLELLLLLPSLPSLEKPQNTPNPPKTLKTPLTPKTIENLKTRKTVDPCRILNHHRPHIRPSAAASIPKSPWRGLLRLAPASPSAGTGLRTEFQMRRSNSSTATRRRPR